VSRLRWSDAQPDDAATPIHWTSVAVITATLFLNLAFWILDGHDFWQFGRLGIASAIFPLVGSIPAAAFFLAPALACFRRKQPLLDLIQSSFGAIPAACIRLCGVCFLLVWSARWISAPVRWLTGFSGRSELAGTQFVALIVIAVAFLMATALRSIVTSAKLAFFSGKLAIAMLVAALIRVRDGLPQAFTGYPYPMPSPMMADVWHDLSQLAFGFGALVFLAADFGYRLPNRRAVLKTGGFGIALALSLTLMVTNFIRVVTQWSWHHSQNRASIAVMEAFADVASLAWSGRFAIGLITIFAMIRFGLRTLDAWFPRGPLPRWGAQLLFAATIAAAPAYATTDAAGVVQDFAGTCLACTASVLTAAAVTRRERVGWRGSLALAAGLLTYILLPAQWWHAGFLPAYAASFLVALALR
jgi:hypothetical protein